MSYRKLKADYLFDGFKLLPDNLVLICEEDGTIEAIAEENQAGSGLEEFSGLLTPGFINCHCHLELSHLKGLIPEKQGLVNFVLAVMSQRNHTEESRQAAILAAEKNMIASGIVAVGDICNTTDTLPVKSSKRLLYYNFIELFGWNPEQAAARYAHGKQLARLFREAGQNDRWLSLNPHAPYSVSPELWGLMGPEFRDKTISIHNQESAAENEFFISGTGDLTRMYSRMNMDTRYFNIPATRSLHYYLPKLKSASKIMLVHNTYMNKADLSEAQSIHENLFFCLCPNANLYIEDRLADIPLLLKHRASIVLGTDSLASNQELSILEEMKTIKNAFPTIPTTQLLLWSTSNGARALSFDNTLGGFSKGKRPGIVLLENTDGGEIHAESTSRRII